MLIISGKLTIDPDALEAVMAAASPMMAATRAEEGNHAYVFSLDMADRSVLHVYERWESEQALAAHFATPHMAEFQAVLGPAVRDMDLARWAISEGPLPVF